MINEPLPPTEEELRIEAALRLKQPYRDWILLAYASAFRFRPAPKIKELPGVDWHDGGEWRNYAAADVPLRFRCGKRIAATPTLCAYDGFYSVGVHPDRRRRSEEEYRASDTFYAPPYTPERS